ncbi:Craniofacial development protein 1 [Mycena sanguinolenta]|uniref:SWR1-complex protein 5 n=1 Tax=Mycena sanguinolenta TaxID=230812 RepID=A0A8H6X519_9AGAR|nr:Craniofacial development protein 1 [Mycena sanguinolenta]
MSAIPKTSESDSDENDSDFVPPAAEEESDSSDDEPALKRARTSSPKPTEEEALANKKARQELWANFQATVDAPAQEPENEPKRMVKIEKRYLFAGEYTVEVVEVPEGSADAKKWPLWRPPEEAAASSGLDLGKPRHLLLTSPLKKARKLSTLDKSAMDWRAHVNAEPSEMKDELEANRRGGGYLEKVEFLNRVDARKEDALQASKSTKRRR